MTTIIPICVTKENFSPYGQLFSMSGHDNQVPLSRPLRLGLTFSTGGSFVCSHMERHKSTEEILFPGEEAMILAVSNDSPDGLLLSEHIRAFIIPPGFGVSLNPGIWHDACHCLSKDACYYFMAHNNGEPDETRWFPISGEPVTVYAPEAFPVSKNMSAPIGPDFSHGASIFKENRAGAKETCFNNSKVSAKQIIFQNNEACIGNSWKCWMTNDDCLDTPGVLRLHTLPGCLRLNPPALAIFCGNTRLSVQLSGHTFTLFPGDLLKLQTDARNSKDPEGPLIDILADTLDKDWGYFYTLTAQRERNENSDSILKEI